ncbi:SDR family oxidoreductase [Marivita hallyeonensis]|uniref:NADP-dependent 3-hydroxy acid dehydrogenase YdfG n=1 Tax=Marivita hallyeonensis TaxID=996342 RepID=A0A1M5R3I9_9RHOB|nr:SDR family oxidoreductase [Marivita hallyeonensis]SHH20718.1 NADP-dependent 3-hydroxy acid dehydrogenase YdfG [Marivita hallyeonensis]
MGPSIIITGAGSGIGKACAEAFLGDGWRVGLIGRREGPLQEIADRYEDALPLPCDVADAAAVETAFATAVATWGRIDALFNNAGVGTFGATIDEIALDDWQRCVDINVTGSFLCARAAFAQMRRQDPQGGRIINNGSISAHVPRWGSVPYTATKHAITGLTRSLSLDGRPFNIACGQIDIGNAETEIVANLRAQAEAAGQPFDATMDVTHVASSVLHMAKLPLDANVQFMTVIATTMPYIGRG